ncbi:MAG TPA: beta-ketoacyl-ACP synthase II [Dehalococcoidia bacterium]
MDTGDRVVITGVGVVSPLGLTGQETWQALLAGKSGIDHIQSFDTEGLEVTFAGEVKGFDPLNYMDRKEARRTDRFVQLAVAATREALAQAELEITPANADEIGVVVGSGIGGIATLFEGVQTFLEKGPGRVSPFLVPMMIGDMAAGQISIMFGAKGPNFCTQSACASGADAIGTCYEILRRGDAKIMITGGAEAGVTPLGVAAFVAARALSTRNDDPQRASRPFDKDRDGFVMAEGATILVLERLDSALRRGAPILAEVLSYGMSADAFHITQPAEGGEGGARAMKMALRKARLAPEQVDYINAHGTSTPFNDRAETMAIKTVFGEHAYQIPISSTKSMTGHLLGAAGAIEAAVCAWTIRDGIIPPTINYTTPDPECDLDYVPNEARKAEVRVALTNSFGFGGHNATLILGRYEE